MPYSEAEFKSIYIRSFPLGMKVALSLIHDEEDSRDIVQEVFLKLWESKEKIKNPQSYILRAVKNACINRINTFNNHEKIKRKISLEPSLDEGEVFQQLEEVKRAIPILLSKREQEVIDRIYSEGMSYKEAAENLNVSTSTINKNIVSSHIKLRNHFKTESHERRR